MLHAAQVMWLPECLGFILALPKVSRVVFYTYGMDLKRKCCVKSDVVVHRCFPSSVWLKNKILCWQNMTFYANYILKIHITGTGKHTWSQGALFSVMVLLWVTRVPGGLGYCWRNYYARYVPDANLCTLNVLTLNHLLRGLGTSTIGMFFFLLHCEETE